MMGTRSPQEPLFAADHLYLDFVGRDTRYGYLAQNRNHLFRDEDFAALYRAHNGRPSVPPSLAVSILFLRAYDNVSFVEAIERTKYDLRWKVALGLEMEEVPIQKSALQEFEAKLVLQEMKEPLLQRSIEEARRAGYLTSSKIRVALDTTPILGKGAVQDTYNLLGEGIEKLARRLLEVDGADEQTWVEQQGLAGYFGSSLKGEAGIDWDDQKQREQWLTQTVGDARRLLSLAEKVKQEHGEQAEAIEADAALLRRLIAQDVEKKSAGGCQVKEGTEKDRIISVHDPEMRHGRKSASKKFNGHKAAVAVNIESQLITGVEVLPGNAGDQEKSAGVGGAKRTGDASRSARNGGRLCLWRRVNATSLCRAKSSPDRQSASHQQRRMFPKTEFAIDLEQMEVRCPAGQTTRDYRSAGENKGGQFAFAAATCAACPLRSGCVRGQGPRTLSIQAEEVLQQQARAHNQTEAGRKSLRERVVVEHRIARLVQLGIRKSRYCGKKKTLWQVVMAALAANVSLVVSYVSGKLGKGSQQTQAAHEVTSNELLPTILACWIRYFRSYAPARVS